MSKKHKVAQTVAAPPYAKAQGSVGACPIKCLLGSVDKLNVAVPILFFVVVWGLLSFYEPAFLRRVEELSVFIFDDVYFNEMVSVPAGILSYLGCFLIQFFHYPALGAAIYTALLFAVYHLTRRVFAIPQRYSLVALLPVVALLASNTQLGYWIFYLKLSGYYYMAVIAVIVSLLGIWVFKKLSWWLRLPFVAVWVFALYPVMGVYASASAAVMAVCVLPSCIRARKGWLPALLTVVLTVLLLIFVPEFYYYKYTAISSEYIYLSGTPSYQWSYEYVSKVVHEDDSIWYNVEFYWVPFFALLSFYLLYPFADILKGKLRWPKLPQVTVAAVVLLTVVALSLYWYRDNNFRIENKQALAMWENDWESVVDYAMDAEIPTRQVVLNKNVALIALGRVGYDMFKCPDGSADIKAPMAVHLTQTGGKMLYYQYGRFNFCYRWCVEDAVEYGWRIEYLKHAVRSMMLSGEYTLASRYINILKSTMFYRGWAEEMEKYLWNPDLISKTPEFAMPLYMTTYEDRLDVDESFVEAFLTRDLMALQPSSSPLYKEVSLTMSLIRKDRAGFWSYFENYINSHAVVDAQGNVKVTVPTHYQEAFLLFKSLELQRPVAERNVDVAHLEQELEPLIISPRVKERFIRFAQKVAEHNSANSSFARVYPELPRDTAQTSQKSNLYMGPHFMYDYGDTYYYYFYFVNKIKTN